MAAADPRVVVRQVDDSPGPTGQGGSQPGNLSCAVPTALSGMNVRGGGTNVDDALAHYTFLFGSRGDLGAHLRLPTAFSMTLTAERPHSFLKRTNRLLDIRHGLLHAGG